MSLDNEFLAWRRRIVEVAREHRRLLLCPVRTREFVDGPEERVRQGLLHFLVDLSKDIGFELCAERERHDIDLRWPMPRDLRPPIPPMLIIETKVDETAGQWTNKQLGQYLAETNGDCGIVFTGRRMWQLNMVGTQYQSAPLSSLGELVNLIQARAKIDPLEGVHVDFAAAQGGDIAALRRLVARYRYATFVLRVCDREVPCRNIRIDGDVLEYRPAGQHVQRPLRANVRDVKQLVRIEP